MSKHYIYVYYRLLVDTDALRLRQQVEVHMALLVERFALKVRLTRRADDPLTWLESYMNLTDADAVLSALQEVAQSFPLTRHVEYFVAFD